MSELELLEKISSDIAALTVQLACLEHRVSQIQPAEQYARLQRENEEYRNLQDERVNGTKAAAILGVSPQTVARLRERKQIASVMVGKTWMYPIKGLKKYIDRHSAN